ncbi:unnamed protein product [Natator depressus]
MGHGPFPPQDPGSVSCFPHSRRFAHLHRPLPGDGAPGLRRAPDVQLPRGPARWGEGPGAAGQLVLPGPESGGAGRHLHQHPGGPHPLLPAAGPRPGLAAPARRQAGRPGPLPLLRPLRRAARGGEGPGASCSAATGRGAQPRGAEGGGQCPGVLRAGVLPPGRRSVLAPGRAGAKRLLRLCRARGAPGRDLQPGERLHLHPHGAGSGGALLLPGTAPRAEPVPPGRLPDHLQGWRPGDGAQGYAVDAASVTAAGHGHGGLALLRHQQPAEEDGGADDGAGDGADLGPPASDVPAGPGGDLLAEPIGGSHRGPQHRGSPSRSAVPASRAPLGPWAPRAPASQQPVPALAAPGSD